MNDSDTDAPQPDPIDEEAAAIDPRSEDAAEKIEALIEHADELGRDADQPIDPDQPL